MSTAAIRAALVALLTAIPGIGRVHGYERFALADKGLLDLYAQDGGVRGWRVSRISSRRRALASGRILVTSRWVIVGLLALVDAAETEILAGDLADAISAAELADPTLGGVVRGRPVEGASGMQLIALEPVMFAGVLCHRVTLQLDAQTYEGAVLDPTQGGDAAAGLVQAVAERIAGLAPDLLFGAVEGRVAWDRDDDPVALPAVVVTPVADLADPDPQTLMGRQRVDRQVAVIILATAAQVRAAGGLDALRRVARDALLGWGDGPDGPADTPLSYAGGTAIDAGPGLIAWRDLYSPAIYLET